MFARFTKLFAYRLTPLLSLPLCLTGKVSGFRGEHGQWLAVCAAGPTLDDTNCTGGAVTDKR